MIKRLATYISLIARAQAMGELFVVLRHNGAPADEALHIYNKRQSVGEGDQSVRHLAERQYCSNQPRISANPRSSSARISGL